MPNIENIKEIFSITQFSDGKLLSSVVSGIIIKESKIFITIDLTDITQKHSIEKAIFESLSSSIPLENINLIFTNAITPQDGEQKKAKLFINNVQKIILISSGKGGVGKSTIPVAMAEKYHALGYKVGIVDADIHGPSIPTLLGISQKPEILENKFIPLKIRGIQLMSVGFLVDRNVAIAWRGPMTSKILYKMLSTTSWDDLDYLLIDMPPGTGDIHLSILENYHINGVIIVTTPQKLSMDDVARAIELYKKFSIPIMGIIENMSNIFDGNAGNLLAERYNISQCIHTNYDKDIAHKADDGKSFASLISLPTLL
jgi:ATP-binding protein involved in chromosome partitioning